MSHCHREHPEGSSSVSCSLGEDETWRTEGGRRQQKKEPGLPCQIGRGQGGGGVVSIMSITFYEVTKSFEEKVM